MEEKTKQQQAEEILRDFLQNELGDYSFHWSTECTEEHNDYFYFDVYYGISEDIKNFLKMRVNPDKEFENTEIDLCDDNWKVVETFNYTIKYFWMKIEWK